MTREGSSVIPSSKNSKARLICLSILCFPTIALLNACTSTSSPLSSAPEAAVETQPQRREMASARGSTRSQSPAPTSSEKPDDLAPLGEGCMSRSEVLASGSLAAQFKTNSPLAVVGVVSDDHLMLRESAAPDAPIVSRLSPNTEGLKPSGRVCDVKGTLWIEVSDASHSGWLNARYVSALGKAQEATAEYSALHPALTTQSVDKLAQAFAHAIERKLKDASEGENEPEATLLIVNNEGDRAVAIIQTCCAMDDSVSGERLSLGFEKSEAGWKLVTAKSRPLCSRGVDEKSGLCR